MKLIYYSTTVERNFINYIDVILELLLKLDFKEYACLNFECSIKAAMIYE